MTKAGNLKCSNILHVVMDPKHFDSTLLKLLMKAEKAKLKSISMPLLGTGELKINPKDASYRIVKRIGKFVTVCHPQSLRLVRVIIIQPNIVTIFRQTMKDVVGKQLQDSKGFVRKLKGASKLFGGGPKKPSLSPTMAYDTLSLNIIAEGQVTIGKAINRIEQLMDDEINTSTISKPLISKLRDKDFKEIITFAKTLSVEVKFNSTGPKSEITIRGLATDVMKVKDEANRLLDKIATKIHEEEKRRTAAQNVKWRFEDKTLGHGQFEEYDELITGQIEIAYKAKQAFVVIEINRRKFRIDFKARTETDLHNQSSVVAVRRELKEGKKPLCIILSIEGICSSGNKLLFRFCRVFHS
ncbi:protein mono-ADP-ribosyltransferase PARP14-like [Glandiceps talaboti]